MGKVSYSSTGREEYPSREGGQSLDGLLEGVGEVSPFEL